MLNMHQSKPLLPGLDDLVYASVFSDQLRRPAAMPSLYPPLAWPSDPSKPPRRAAYPTLHPGYPSSSPPASSSSPSRSPQPPSASPPAPLSPQTSGEPGPNPNPMNPNTMNPNPMNPNSHSPAVPSSPPHAQSPPAFLPPSSSTYPSSSMSFLPPNAQFLPSAFPPFALSRFPYPNGSSASPSASPSQAMSLNPSQAMSSNMSSALNANLNSSLNPSLNAGLNPALNANANPNGFPAYLPAQPASLSPFPANAPMSHYPAPYSGSSVNSFPANSVNSFVSPNSVNSFGARMSHAQAPGSFDPLRSFYLSGGDGMFIPSPPRKRHRPTEVQLEMLEREFDGNRKPGVKRRMELAKATGMTERQIQVWFQNHRARRKGQRDEKRSKGEEEPEPEPEQGSTEEE